MSSSVSRTFSGAVPVAEAREEMDTTFLPPIIFRYWRNSRARFLRRRPVHSMPPPTAVKQRRGTVSCKNQAMSGSTQRYSAAVVRKLMLKMAVRMPPHRVRDLPFFASRSSI